LQILDQRQIRFETDAVRQPDKRFKVFLSRPPNWLTIPGNLTFFELQKTH